MRGKWSEPIGSLQAGLQKGGGGGAGEKESERVGISSFMTNWRMKIKNVAKPEEHETGQSRTVRRRLVSGRYYVSI
jgi:hypothetical protein